MPQRPSSRPVAATHTLQASEWRTPINIRLTFLIPPQNWRKNLGFRDNSAPMGNEAVLTKNSEREILRRILFRWNFWFDFRGRGHESQKCDVKNGFWGFWGSVYEGNKQTWGIAVCGMTRRVVWTTSDRSDSGTGYDFWRKTDGVTSS